MKEVRVCNEKNCDIWDYQLRVLIQWEMEVNGMWSIVNIEKTLSPPRLSLRSTLRFQLRSPLLSPLRSTLLSPLRSTLRSLLRYSLRSLF